MMPSVNQFERTFENAFLIYKPKDIVSGDFYWMEDLDDKVLFAVGDCTGHGVSGAMVSIIAVNSLNKAVQELHYNDPSDILGFLSDSIEATFSQNESEVQDGLDIALCVLHKKTMRLKFSGAYSPLYVIRKGELIEYKGTRRPAGKFVNNDPFNTIEIQLEHSDNLYLITDGYKDQLGGANNKRYKSKTMKNVLIEISNQPLKEQQEILTALHNDWKGEHEQTDDICLMGLRIKEQIKVNPPQQYLV